MNLGIDLQQKQSSSRTESSISPSFSIPMECARGWSRTWSSGCRRSCRTRSCCRQRLPIDWIFGDEDWWPERGPQSVKYCEFAWDSVEYRCPIYASPMESRRSENYEFILYFMYEMMLKTRAKRLLSRNRQRTSQTIQHYRMSPDVIGFHGSQLRSSLSQPFMSFSAHCLFCLYFP